MQLGANLRRQRLSARRSVRLGVDGRQRTRESQRLLVFGACRVRLMWLLEVVDRLEGLAAGLTALVIVTPLDGRQLLVGSGALLLPNLLLVKESFSLALEPASILLGSPHAGLPVYLLLHHPLGHGLVVQVSPVGAGTAHVAADR